MFPLLKLEYLEFYSSAFTRLNFKMCKKNKGFVFTHLTIDRDSSCRLLKITTYSRCQLIFTTYLCQVIIDHFFHLNSGLEMSSIVLFNVFLNEYQQFKEDLVYRMVTFKLVKMSSGLKLDKNEPKKVSHSSFSSIQPVYHFLGTI